MRFADLDGRSVAVLGDGAEGKAAVRALRRWSPTASVRVLSESADGQSHLEGVPIERGRWTAASLARFDAVIRSPGVPTRHPALVEARAVGLRVTSGTNLWAGLRPRQNAIAVTGTKGKSTTAAMIAHAVRACGRRCVLAGNIGVPLLKAEIDQPDAEAIWVIELSSYQLADFEGGVGFAVLTNLSPEHLDWHGSYDAYINDKLRLFRGMDPERVLDVDQADELCRVVRGPQTLNGLGVSVGGTGVMLDGAAVIEPDGLRVPGMHNLQNAAGAIAAARMIGLDAHIAARSLGSFEGLPHRLQTVFVAGGIRFVDDSLSTTPAATLMAVRAMGSARLAVLVGGFDRGVSWSAAADALAGLGNRLRVIAMPPSGERAARALVAAGAVQRGVEVTVATDLDDAVEQAVAGAEPESVVLMSPGAPSYHAFDDHRARGRAFLAAAERAVRRLAPEGNR